MAPHYERPQSTAETAPNPGSLGNGPGDEVIDDAAEALRQTEIEAVKPGHDAVTRGAANAASGGAGSGPVTTEVASLSPSELANMSIDELRGVAAVLDVPEREKIIEQDELIEAIRRRLPR